MSDDPPPLPDLPASERDCLLTVARCGGTPDAPLADLPRMKTVAAAMDAARAGGVSYRTVSRTARRLREHGHLASTVDRADNRARCYRVTEQGMGVLDRLADHHRWARADARGEW